MTDSEFKRTKTKFLGFYCEVKKQIFANKKSDLPNYYPDSKSVFTNLSRNSQNLITKLPINSRFSSQDFILEKHQNNVKQLL
ncbi:hypothetical protein BpHYR1_032956 [Brachionus plicatilis]|uniref:Uncharacterized protein n=1 Tax=Brachionus plicatilis TaxID=10195 RepID=A0A3M7QSQ9_BRAPC|nr:hypothetical protein BpHYR1_032956 [Brachionus plicatilis]